MSKTIHELVNDCARDVQDVAKSYWKNEDWLIYANDGRAQMWELKPRLFEVTEPMSLTAGITQIIPNGSKLLYEVVSNLSHSSKRSVNITSEELLSRARPNWRGEAPSGRIFHFMYDEQRPGSFNVYPPAIAGTSVQVRYAKPPAVLTMGNIDGTTAFALDEEGAQYVALGYYMKARAYMKGANSSNGYGSKASGWMELFQADVIGESNSKTRNSPNANKLSGAGPSNKQP